MRFLTLMILLAGVSAHAKPVQYEGSFGYDHEIITPEDASACAADQGHMREDGVCVLPTSDVADVTSTDGKLNLSISTMANSMNTCDFQADAEVVSDTEIRASLPTQSYDTGVAVNVTCTVNVKYADDGESVHVRTNGQCGSMCGLNATLEIDKALRLRKPGA